MARNCRFPKFGTHGCQRGNHRLLLQGTAGPKKVDLGTSSFLPWQPLGPTHGTISSNLEELKVLCNGTLWFPGWEPGVPTSGNRQFLGMVTYGSHFGSHEFQSLGTGSSFPTWEPEVTIASTCRFPEVRIMCSKLSGYH